jgi:Zn-dependent M16 (insulinase) family peptidase
MSSVATLDTLEAGAVLHGFDTVARYRDGGGRAVGGRFVHRATGFELDTLRIDSAPQAFIWVNTLPTSDAGEPHTQEHLLIGKGTVGSRVANLKEMSLAESSAFTEKWRTCYHLHTTVAATFWTVLEADLDGLLHPDYTDEEIRREVRNFGVTGRDGRLALEEKGTVYNEMVRSYEQPGFLMWRAFEQAVYGVEHPLALASGGWPDAIRAMTPEDIRRFHRDHYHLANMGMVASLPPPVSLDELLGRADEILTRLAARTGAVRGTPVTMDRLPPPRGAPPGTILTVEYPSASAAKPSPLYLVWPATRELPLAEKVLLDLFLDAFAGDESTDLYKLLVDSRTCALDTGATGVGSSPATTRACRSSSRSPTCRRGTSPPRRCARSARRWSRRSPGWRRGRRTRRSSRRSARASPRGSRTRAAGSPRPRARRRASASATPRASGTRTCIASVARAASSAR